MGHIMLLEYDGGVIFYLLFETDHYWGIQEFSYGETEF